MTIEELYTVFQNCQYICTDSRKVEAKGIFFSLKGDNFDGNTCAESALNNGCLYAVIDDAKYNKDNRFILVENALKALQDLARYHRSKLNIPIIGITGTNGKTTTKELVHAAIRKKYQTLATTGNLNNHIGVPKTILNITKNTEIAIIEMGANHIGEIAELCEIAQPDYGMITNIGKAHLEGFGSFEGVVKAKKEMYDWIHKKRGTLFVNLENNLLSALSENTNRITYSENALSDYTGRFIKANPYLEMEWINKKINISNIIQSNLVGSYNLENILAAVTIGSFFKIEENLIKQAIEEYIPTNNRSQIIKSTYNTIIMDAYNANPSSMEAALNNFTTSTSPNKIVILGDMFELGNDSEKEHSNLLNFIISKNFDKIILVGNMFFKINKDKNIPTFRNTDELTLWLKENKLKDATILVKGSRGVKMEKTLGAL